MILLRASVTRTKIKNIIHFGESVILPLMVGFELGFEFGLGLRLWLGFEFGFESVLVRVMVG